MKLKTFSILTIAFAATISNLVRRHCHQWHRALPIRVRELIEDESPGGYNLPLYTSEPRTVTALL